MSTLLSCREIDELPGDAAELHALRARALQLVAHLLLRGAAQTLGARASDNGAGPLASAASLDGWTLGIKWDEAPMIAMDVVDAAFPPARSPAVLLFRDPLLVASSLLGKDKTRLELIDKTYCLRERNRGDPELEYGWSDGDEWYESRLEYDLQTRDYDRRRSFGRAALREEQW